MITLDNKVGKIINRNSLTGRTILYSVSKLFSQGINAISAIIFVRLLTTEEYGYVSVYMAWVSIITMFIALRTDGTIQIAKTKYGKEKLDEYCSSALTLSILFFCFLGIVILFFMVIQKSIFTKPIWYVVLLIMHSMGSACLNFRSAYYAVTKEAFKDLMVSVLVSTLSLLSALLFVSILPEDKYIGRIGGFAISNILMGILFVCLMLKKGRCYFNKEYFHFCIKLSLPLIFSGISSIVISQADRLMLEKMKGAEETAIYSFGYNIILPISILWYSLNHAWTPEYHEMMKEGNVDKVKKHSNNYIFVFTCLSAEYVLISNEILSVLGTKEYYTAKTILPLIALCYYLQFLYTFPINYEFFKGNTKLLGIATTLSAIINIAMNAVLIPRYAMVGAMIASVLAAIFMFAFHDLNARLILKNYHYNVFFYLRGIIPFALVMIIVYIFPDNIVARWGIALLIGAVLIKHIYKEKAII